MRTPTNKALYARVKRAAKAKFDTYPSAYANAWLVREYVKCGGKYRGKASKKRTLKTWFDKEDWRRVDYKKPPSKWEPCGTRPGKGKGKIGKCLPLKKAQSMSVAERKSAQFRKAKNERKRKGKSPSWTPTFKESSGLSDRTKQYYLHIEYSPANEEMDQLIQKAARKPGSVEGDSITYRYATKRQAQLASRRVLAQAEKNKDLYAKIKAYIS